MTSNNFRQRRQLLRGAAGAAMLGALAAAPAIATAQSRTTDGAGPRVTQLLDMSADQQELSRDYATGIRLALAEHRKANVFGPQLSTVEADGTAVAARNAVQPVWNDPAQVALLGTVGEGLALAALDEASRSKLDIAHVAPWLADSQFDGDAQLFGLFASREDQLRYVLGNLANMGVSELGMVYPSPAHAKALGAGAEVIGERLSAAVRRSAVAGQPRRLPGGALCSAGDRERGPNPTRARVLSEFQRRRPIELDGWRIEYMHGARGSAFVSQTLLNTQGASFG